MEQHPVPRDITGFQFKLVGTMTLKQFAYVAGGALIGFVFYKAPLGIFSLPLAGLFWFLGFALAFIPIQERPMERWLGAFIKSVYSPTQFVWKKTPSEIEVLKTISPKKKGGKSTPVSQYLDSKKKLRKYLSSLPSPVEYQLDQQEKESLLKTLSLFQKTAAPATQPAARPAQTKPRPTAPPAPPAKEEPISPPKKEEKPFIPAPLKIKAEKKIDQEKKEEEPISETKPVLKDQRLEQKIKALKEELELRDISRDRYLELSKQLTQAQEEKRRLTEQIQALKKKAETKKEAVTPSAPEQKKEVRVKTITPELASEKGMPQVPQAPNIISGIIKNSSGALLPNLIISVKDKDGQTVRALKTNNAGLFVSATPLDSGIYTLEIEDPKKKYEFDIIKINLKGDVYSPLEIIAKGETEQLREKLSQELFG